jgi:hypothetical protein
VLLDLLHRALRVEREHEHARGVRARIVLGGSAAASMIRQTYRDGLALVHGLPRQGQSLRAVEARGQADLVDLVRVDL